MVADIKYLVFESDPNELAVLDDLRKRANIPENQIAYIPSVVLARHVINSILKGDIKPLFAIIGGSLSSSEFNPTSSNRIAEELSGLDLEKLKVLNFSDFAIPGADSQVGRRPAEVIRIIREYLEIKRKKN